MPYITASVGVASLIPSFQISALHLINAADQSLYEAKKSGRNQTVLYREKSDTKLPVIN